MLGPYGSLNCKVLHWVAVVIWALYLVGVPDVAIVHLHPLAWLKAVRKFIHKKYIVPLTSGVLGSTYPD